MMYHPMNEIGEGMNQIYHCPLMKAMIFLKGNSNQENDIQDITYLVFAHDYYLSFSNELNLLNMKSSMFLPASGSGSGWKTARPDGSVQNLAPSLNLCSLLKQNNSRGLMQMKSAPCTDITRGAFQCGWRDSNPHALWAGDFKSPVSAIPPQPRFA